MVSNEKNLTGINQEYRLILNKKTEYVCIRCTTRFDMQLNNYYNIKSDTKTVYSLNM